MKYQIRSACLTDLSVILEIYAMARQFMAEHKNPDQWGSLYPSEDLIKRDISQNKLYVIENENGVHGVFYFAVEQDATYAYMENGSWNGDQPYGVIHRIAGDGSGGILRTAVNYAREKIQYLRMDTHEDNYVMQHALEKLGFSRCGIIYIEDGTPRIAYDSYSVVREAREEDLDALLQLYTHLHESSIPNKDEHLISTWKKIVDDPDHHLIVCEVNGEIVSSCVCVVIPNLTRNIRPYAFVENVVTNGNHRGKGYASTCLKYASWIARDADCYKIMLLTGSKEEKTLSFYKNAGYNSTDKTAFIRWLDK